MIKSSEPFTESLAKAQNNPQIVEQLGEPIKAGLGISGSIKLEGTSGEAEFSYTVSGPKGSAQVYVAGTKQAGNWTYETMAVDLPDGRIDLTESPAVDGAIESIEGDAL